MALNSLICADVPLRSCSLTCNLRWIVYHSLADPARGRGAGGMPAPVGGQAIDTWSIVRPVRRPMRWRTWPWHTRRVLLVND